LKYAVFEFLMKNKSKHSPTNFTNLHEIRTRWNSLLCIISRIFTWRWCCDKGGVSRRNWGNLGETGRISEGEGLL